MHHVYYWPYIRVNCRVERVSLIQKQNRELVGKACSTLIFQQNISYKQTVNISIHTTVSIWDNGVRLIEPRVSTKFGHVQVLNQLLKSIMPKTIYTYIQRHSLGNHKNFFRYIKLFLISNFRLVLNVVCFLLGNSPTYEFYMRTFRNTLSVPSS